MSLYHFELFTVLDESATDKSSNKHSEDQFGCPIDDFSVLNRVRSYSSILDFCRAVDFP